jgi:hypothetical protein
MRVSIEHSEESMGLVFKKPLYAVTATIQFSEEELAIIKTRRLKEFVVLDRDWQATLQKKVEAHPDYWATLAKPHLKVGDLMRGRDTYTFFTPIEAKSYENKLTDALKQLKQFIAGNAATAESKTFEL